MGGDGPPGRVRASPKTSLDAARGWQETMPCRSLELRVRPHRTPAPTATGRSARAPRRGWWRRDRWACFRAMHCSIYDLVPRCLGPQASRPCSRAQARQARTQAAFRAARRAGWEARRCGTAPRWRGRVRRGRGGALRWRSGWPTLAPPIVSRMSRSLYVSHG